MTRKRSVTTAILLTSILLTSLVVTGCTDQKEVADLKGRVDSLEKQVAAIGPLEKRVADIETQKSAAPAAATTSPPTTPTSANSSTSTSTATAAAAATGFTDTAGLFGEQQITALNQLGIFDHNSGQFEPHKTMTRGEFAEWLLKTNNAYWHPNIHLAETGPATFPDVPETHPLFKYIQGLVNSGLVIGFDDKRFKPDNPLTREEMIAMKMQANNHGNIRKTAKELVDAGKGPDGCHWPDSNQISKRYYDAFNEENQGYGNINAVWGGTKFLKPKSPVTRAEAAVCVENYNNAAPTNYDHGSAVEKAKSLSK